MAMVKPIAQSKNAFDATKPEYFSFTSVGGNQVVKNRITIRNNTNNAVVYTNTVETFANGQEVPANKLTNGTYYNFFFNTFDINGTMSPDSNVISFYCYTQPTLRFLNVTQGATIESSNFLFIAEYNQIQGELLDNLKFNLYDINGSLLASSPVLYTSEAPPTQFSYSFDGMENNTSYRIKVEGVTINGTTISSDTITFEVRFENPAVYTKIDLENKCDDGYIQFRSNLIFVDANSNPDPPEYINGTAADLCEMGRWVEWMEGFEIPSGFVLELWMNPALLGEFCKLWNKSSLNDYIQLNLKRSYYQDSIYPKDCFEVYAKQGTNTVRKYSNVVEALNNLSDVIVWVKKVGSTWELFLDVVNRTPSVMEWNSTYPSESNVQYNKITDMYWDDDTVTYIRYSPNVDGSGMTVNKQANSKYIGVIKVPVNLFNNTNLLINSDFSSGTNNWIGTNNSIMTVLDQVPSDLPPIPETGSKAMVDLNNGNVDGHTVQAFDKLSPGIYTLSSYVMIPSDYPNAVNITKWRYPSGGQYMEPETKSFQTPKGQWVRLVLTVNLTVEDRYVFSIGGGNRGSTTSFPVYSWHPKLEMNSFATDWSLSPKDLINDKTKYTWTLIPDEFEKDT